MTDILPILIAGLATFRLAVLVSEDDGPSRIFQRFRSMLKREAKQHPTLRKSAVHEGIECLRCSSIWLALPIAMFMFWREDVPGWLRVSGDVFLMWMSLSAMAILFNRAFPKR